MTKKEYKVEGMKCEHCVESVRKGISSVGGVSEVAVSLRDKTAVVVSAEPVSIETLQAALGGHNSSFKLTDL